jgi:hypothetical protein
MESGLGCGVRLGLSEFWGYGSGFTQDISNEEDGNAGLVLSSRKIKIILDVVDLSERDGITIEVVEPVHQPQPSKSCQPELSIRSKIILTWA